VASVAVGGGVPRNGGLLVVQFLALSNVGLQEQHSTYRHGLAEKVNARDEALQKSLRYEKK